MAADSESGRSPTPCAEPARTEQAGVAHRPRGLGQRIAFGIAILCYSCACLCLVAIPIWIQDLGSEHPVIASLGASVVFFVGAGVVLHVIGRANLPDLRVHTEDSSAESP